MMDGMIVPSFLDCTCWIMIWTSTNIPKTQVTYGVPIFFSEDKAMSGKCHLFHRKISFHGWWTVTFGLLRLSGKSNAIGTTCKRYNLILLMLHLKVTTTPFGSGAMLPTTTKTRMWSSFVLDLFWMMLLTRSKSASLWWFVGKNLDCPNQYFVFTISPPKKGTHPMV